MGGCAELSKLRVDAKSSLSPQVERMKCTCWMGEQERALAVKKSTGKQEKGQLACQKNIDRHKKRQLQGNYGHSKCERVDAKSKP